MKRLILIQASFIIVSSALAQSTRCITTPVNIMGSQTTITSSGAKSVTQNETYIYYERKCHKKHGEVSPMAATMNEYSSRPLLLNADKNVKAIPETYNVSLSTPQSKVFVCPDSTLNLNTGINVERVSSYTGNYPNGITNKEYKKVSKRDYMIARRKIYKIERKEEKIARKSHTDVDIKSGMSM